jgi:hypothetical protein
MDQKKPFWETLPGCLTAIGGTIAAIAALLTALYTTGVIGNKDQPIPVSSPVVAVQLPSPAASTLPATSRVKAEVTPVPSSEPTHAPTREATPAASEEAKEEYAMSALEMGIDRYGGEDYSDFASPSAQACSDSCLKDPKCKSFAFNLNANQCWLKASVPRRVENTGFASGVKILK